MKTSRLVLAPAVAVAITGLAGAPASASTTSPALPPTALCAYDESPATADDDSAVPDSSTPQATVAAAQVSRDEIVNKKKGVGFSGTGFSPDEKATVTVVGTDGTKYTPETKLTVDENGKVNGTYFFSTTEGAQVPLGTYTLYLTDLKTEQDSSKVTFEVVAKDSDKDDSGTGSDCVRPTAPAPTPSETPTETPTETPSQTPTEPPAETTPPSQTPTETETPSPAPTPSQTETPSPAPTPTETEKPAPKDSPATPSPTQTPTETPTETPSQTPTETNDPTPSAPNTETTAPASPGSTDDEDAKAAPAAQQALIIDPTEISSEDFLNKGVQLGVTGAQPGEKITVVVEHAQGKVDRYTMTKDADAQGKATFGVQAKVKSVLGTYNVRVQAESFDKPQGGSFTVVTNGTDVGDGSGGSGSGSGSGSGTSNDLPRTGAEMTGLALGAGLLVVGAAAVVITRRRTNAAADDPAQF